jgi:hypothetical protein
MKHASQQRTAGVGMAVGALVIGSTFWLSCQPGELPCEQNDQWRALCDPQGAGGSGGTPSPGPTGGAPPAAPAALSATTPIMNCAQWPTLGDMDKFFANRCGVNATCHASGAPWTDMQKQGVWQRFTTDATSKAKVSCSGAPLANTGNWRESVIWTKTQTPASCPTGGGGSAGLTMPPQMLYEPKMALLSAAELTCLEGFLKALGGK